MSELCIEAMAMVAAPVDEVHAALADYPDVRKRLLPDNFTDYRVESGGHGVGTELSFRMRLGGPKRLLRRRRSGGPVWDCQVRVEEVEPERLVERDLGTGLVTTWTVLGAGDGRSAVRVCARWEGPDGATKALTRAGMRLSVREVYEAVLTNLHHHFEPAPDTA